jgi:gas vesicle protein
MSHGMTSNNGTTASHNSHALLALLAGIGTGLAAGILLAPKSGSRTRAEIGHAARGYMDEACSCVECAKANVASAVDMGVRDINRAIDQTVAAVRSGAKIGHDALNEAAATLHAGTGL